MHRNLKLGVVHPHYADVSPETLLFDKVPNFDVKYVGSTDPGSKWFDNPKYTYVKIKKILPDFISDLIVRRPYSEVSFVKLKGLENVLQDVDLVSSAELYSFTSGQCADFSKNTGKPLVPIVLETLSSLPIHSLPLYNTNVRKVLKNAQSFIAFSQRAANYLLNMSAPKDRVKVVYPGLDLNVFFPPAKPTHDNLRVLFVGRFDKEKGLSLLLQAFSQLCSELKNIELWICAKHGTDPDEKRLAYDFSKSYPVKILGQIQYSQIPEIYRQCDVFCLPSFDRKKWGINVWEEQVGFVFIEAMASGLPVVTTNCGAIPEIVGSENFVIDQHSVSELHLALKKVLVDEDLRANLSETNRARAERFFDIKKQRRKVEALLRGVIESRG
ncbi:MAG: glycosyltransferase family 4 protein [Candidatus Bathyarchaeota archaeon]